MRYSEVIVVVFLLLLLWRRWRWLRSDGQSLHWCPFLSWVFTASTLSLTRQCASLYFASAQSATARHTSPSLAPSCSSYRRSLCSSVISVSSPRSHRRQITRRRYWRRMTTTSQTASRWRR